MDDVQITHAERVIDEARGAIKLDLVRFYAKAVQLMMEQLRGRPLALMRAPR